MKSYVPVITVGVALLFFYNSQPKLVSYFLIFILIMLVLNKWDTLQTYFQ